MKKNPSLAFLLPFLVFSVPTMAQEVPVPFPESAKIYNRDGDGIADSLRIVYNRGFRRDSLPNALVVRWSPTSTRVYGLGKIENNQYTNSGIGTQANIDYWKDPNHYIKLGGLGTDINQRDNSVDNSALELNVKDTIILKGKFSSGVLTRSESGKIASWVTLKIGNSPPNHVSLTSNIEDKIPAIIVRAAFAADETNRGCGSSPANPCRDLVALEFSEPVKIDPSASNATDEQIKNAFAYVLFDNGGFSWDILKTEFLPSNNSMRYLNSGTMRPSENGNDSIVAIYFNRWRSQGNNSWTPMPGDSVKFASLWRHTSFTKNILVDLKGNAPNPNEIGRNIEGQKPGRPKPDLIITVTPIIPDYSKTANAKAMQLIKNGVSLQVTKNTSLEIFNLKGKLIRKMDFANGVYSVELSDLPKGMYIAKARFENSKTETLKIPVM